MDLDLPGGLVGRPLTMDDVTAVASIISASEQRFFGEVFIDAGDLAGGWSAPTTDLTADSWGILDGGVVVGAALVDQRHHLEVDVHPAHVGRGVGTALAAWAEGRSRAMGLTHGEQGLALADVAGAALLDGRGYVPVDREWMLRMGAETSLPTRDLPSDVRIGAFSEGDARAVHTVIEDAFEEWEGRIRRSYEDWRAMIVDRADVDLGHFRVARSGGEVVGVATVIDSDGTTWIPQLAVRSDRRGEGIAQQLLAEAFAAGRARGCATGELSTSGRTGALGLYQRLGMQVVAEFKRWRITY